MRKRVFAHEMACLPNVTSMDSLAKPTLARSRRWRHSLRSLLQILQSAPSHSSLPLAPGAVRRDVRPVELRVRRCSYARSTSSGPVGAASITRARERSVLPDGVHALLPEAEPIPSA